MGSTRPAAGLAHTLRLMRNLALADVTADHIRQMRQENETLFVEFKSSVEGDGYKIAEAVASFSNTLGGWVLIGLRDDGTPSGWGPPQNITDRVRQILDRWLDPLPAFAAQLREHDGDPIGLVRVYESADTPHVLKNGKVVVRSVAEVRNQTQVYRPGGVDTQIVLRQLAERGRHAIRDARDRLDTTRSIQQAIGITNDGTGPRMAQNVAVRAVPLAADRLEDLAVSIAGRELLDETLLDLAQLDEGANTTLRPRPSGLVCEIEPRSHFLDGLPPIPRTAITAADAAGVIAVAFRFHVQSPSRPPRITLDGFQQGIIGPLLRGAVQILDRAELYGRSILELQIGDLSFALAHDTGKPVPDASTNLGPDGVLDLTGAAGEQFPRVALGGEVSLPIPDDAVEVKALADQWRDDVGRAMGLETLRP
jgi:Putative DNA-binding domain